MPKIIDGKKTSQKIKDRVKNEISELGVTPGLAVVLVGDDQASQVYVNNKKKACEYVGIKSISYNLPDNAPESEILELIDKLNSDKNINGILVQLPLPKQIDSKKVLERIDPLKDVDGFHPVSIGRLYTGTESLVPCTPAGVMELLEAYDIDPEGRHAVIVGRSNIVGKPASQLLLDAGATISVCHSKTKNLSDITKQADILVAAVGRPKMITIDMLKDGVVIMDVGINKDKNGKLCGDVDYDDVLETCSAITPVPGGVGPMTIAMLMNNCLKAWSMQNN